jgi:hypothetical protein
MVLPTTNATHIQKPSSCGARGGAHEENRIAAIVIGLLGRRKALRAARDLSIQVT